MARHAKRVHEPIPDLSRRNSRIFRFPDDGPPEEVLPDRGERSESVVRKGSSLSLPKRLLHPVEFGDVGFLHPRGPGAGKAHGQENEAVFCEEVFRLRFALGVEIGRRLKIQPSKFFRTWEGLNGLENILVVFAKVLGDFSGARNGMVLDDLDGRRKRGNGHGAPQRKATNL